tara:strand:+ start:13522 stop:14730 length:1209 start_codon:yes stop_codon:yes gene_type:complete
MTKKQVEAPQPSHDKSVHIWGSKLRAKLDCQKTFGDEKLILRDAALLSPNFEALALYLRSATPDLAQDTSLPKETQKWIADGKLDTLDGTRLKNIFTAMAKQHQALMRNECVITSAAAHEQIIGNAANAITSIPRVADPKKLTFGFIKSAAKKDGGQARHGKTFPLVALPSKITRISDITPDHPLVKTLQSIYSLTNHDWLHQMTLSAVHPAICDYKKTDRKVEKWAEKHFQDSAARYPTFDFGYNETLYEGWAVYTNAQLMNASPEGKMLKAEILTTAMQMINLGKAYIEDNNHSDKAMKTAYWFMLQTTKTLRNIIPVDGFEMRCFIEAAASHLPHPERYAQEHIEHIKYRLYEGHDALCFLQSPHLAHDEVKKEKFTNFTQDNAKITAEIIAHLDHKFG